MVRDALKVARGLVLFLKRPGGQSQFSVELQRQMHDSRGRFDHLHEWIRANLDGDLSVPALADEARGQLERNPPAFVIVEGMKEVDNLDGIPNRVRVPWLFAWVDQNYPRRTRIGRFVVATK